MTPDAHPIIGPVGDGLYAACGFSGHGFVQSPRRWGTRSPLSSWASMPFALDPYRLERFAGEPIFPETLVL